MPQSRGLVNNWLGGDAAAAAAAAADVAMQPARAVAAAEAAPGARLGVVVTTARSLSTS